MEKMNLGLDRKNVRRPAKRYGMSECTVREMLAIERGESQGDVITVPDEPTASPPGDRLRSGMIALVAAFSRSHR